MEHNISMVNRVVNFHNNYQVYKQILDKILPTTYFAQDFKGEAL